MSCEELAFKSVCPNNADGDDTATTNTTITTTTTTTTINYYNDNSMSMTHSTANSTHYSNVLVPYV